MAIFRDYNKNNGGDNSSMYQGYDYDNCASWISEAGHG